MPTTRQLTADGRRLLLDGRPLRPFGLRLANALEDDRHADQLVAHLGEYAEYGIGSFSVFLQGAWSGTANAFRADGTLDPAYMARLARIIEAADAHEMAVNVGYLYQSRPFRETSDRTLLERMMRGELSREGWALRDVFTDGNALVEGVANATRWLKGQGYANVFVDIANEFNTAGYRQTKPMYDVADPQCMLALIRLARDIYPGLLVGASVYDVWHLYAGIGAEGGIVLVHGLPARLKKQVMSHYPGVPVVENESGNWLGCLDRYDSVGVFSEEMKAIFKADCREMFEAGEYWYLFSRWQQMVPVHFELGGYGTAEDPGIRWMLEYFRDLWQGRA